jgi:hypothetical protein
MAMRIVSLEIGLSGLLVRKHVQVVNIPVSAALHNKLEDLDSLVTHP